MSTVAFGLIAFMLAIYVLLDGYDLGIAAITPLVARTDREREGSMRCIGPFWNGNEVWLIAAGGVLFALFPQAYASSFSGFYLPFIVVLWLLMFRGIAMELRSHFPTEIWHQFWDAAFAISSALLILLFGVALGNIVRGLPLDAQGYFAGTFAYLLNPYALLVGIFAVAVLMLHGAAFLVMRTQGPAEVRTRALMRPLWAVVLVLYLAVSAYTVVERGASVSWIDAIALVSLVALGALAMLARRGHDRRAFTASCIWVASLLVQAAATLYPYLLAGPGGKGGLSIFAAEPSPVALASALGVTIVGLIAVAIYGTLVFRQMAGKVSVGE